MLTCRPGLADEGAVQLKEGAGKSVVAANCAVCHSLDYIQINSGILDRAGWEKTINKMMRLGARIKDTDKDTLLDYLSRQYGK